jgi:citrate lyase synthetase
MEILWQELQIAAKFVGMEGTTTHYNRQLNKIFIQEKYVSDNAYILIEMIVDEKKIILTVDDDDDSPTSDAPASLRMSL